jgi:hypothetical protein
MGWGSFKKSFSNAIKKAGSQAQGAGQTIADQTQTNYDNLGARTWNPAMDWYKKKVTSPTAGAIIPALDYQGQADAAQALRDAEDEAQAQADAIKSGPSNRQAKRQRRDSALGRSGTILGGDYQPGNMLGGSGGSTLLGS